MPVLSIHHLTRYRYRHDVSVGEHRMMFRPLESHDQQVVTQRLTITPTPSRLHCVHDVFGNCVGVAEFAAPTAELTFQSDVVLRHTPVPAFASLDGEVEPLVSAVPFAYDGEYLPDLAQSIEPHCVDHDQAVERWARSFLRATGRTRIPGLLAEMAQAIHGDFKYSKRLQGPAQTPTETLALRSGACRDFAMLMIEALRRLGFAAQFVSGYVRTPRPADAAATPSGGHTHAWMRVYLPQCGWIECDPTNGVIGNANLGRVAVARDPRQALPLSGAWYGRAGDFLGMDVTVDVSPASEAVG